MKPSPFPTAWNRGVIQQMTAETLNKLYKLVESRSDFTSSNQGMQVHVDGTGVHTFGDDIPHNGFWAKIVSYLQSPSQPYLPGVYVYSWQRLFEGGDGSFEVVANQGGDGTQFVLDPTQTDSAGQPGKPIIPYLPAYETNNRLVPPGTVVRMHWGTGPWLYFSVDSEVVTVRVTDTPTTSSTATISSGVQVVTPVSTCGIYVGLGLLVGTGATQERVVVTAITATTFTATFLSSHTGPVAIAATYNANGFYPAVVTAMTAVTNTWVDSDPCTIESPNQTPLVVGQRYRATLLGPDPTNAAPFPSTTIAANIPAGTQTVTPASMCNIVIGMSLLIDAGARQETVVVTSITTTTFTAFFARTHTGAVSVSPLVPTQAYLGFWDPSEASSSSGAGSTVTNVCPIFGIASAPGGGTIQVMTGIVVEYTNSDGTVVCVTNPDNCCASGSGSGSGNIDMPPAPLTVLCAPSCGATLLPEYLKLSLFPDPSGASCCKQHFPTVYFPVWWDAAAAGGVGGYVVNFQGTDYSLVGTFRCGDWLFGDGGLTCGTVAGLCYTGVAFDYNGSSSNETIVGSQTCSPFYSELNLYDVPGAGIFAILSEY